MRPLDCHHWQECLCHLPEKKRRMYRHQKQAQKLAEFGRHGDIYFIHAAKGETVIPLEVLNANPKVKDMLFNQMREMGLDPEEFVVGNELNSINPVTGMPEFFFSSIWRSVKKAASSAWKSIKKAAPYVLPLVFSAFGVPFLSSMGETGRALFGVGSFGAAFLGSGIGTLAAGGSMKDALKAGAMAGVGSAVWSGVTSIGSPEGFMGGVKQSFYNPNAADFTTQLGRFTGALDPKGPEGSFAEFWKGERPPEISVEARVGAPVLPREISVAAPPVDPTVGTLQNPLVRPSKVGVGIWEDPLVSPSGPPPEWLRKPAPPGAVPLAQPAPSVSVASKGVPSTGSIEKPSWYSENIGKYISGGGETPEKWASIAKDAGEEAFTATMLRAEGAGVPKAAAFKAAEAARTAAMTKVGPSALATYGPTVGGAVAAYGIYESFQPSQEELEEEERKKKEEAEKKFREGTGAALFARNRAKYMLSPEALDPRHFTPPSLLVQAGGLAEYPPRDLLVEGAGTERSDEIPAMLSDGEFVMNAKSVRGADPSGGGNRYAGANNLYKMMRNFEMRS